MQMEGSRHALDHYWKSVGTKSQSNRETSIVKSTLEQRSTEHNHTANGEHSDNKRRTTVKQLTGNRLCVRIVIWETRCKEAKNKHHAVGKQGFSCDPTLDDNDSGTKIR